MKKHTLFSLLFLLAAVLASAQSPVSISGVVTRVGTGAPVPNHSVYCFTGDSVVFAFVEAITDQNGAYTAQMDLPAGFNTVSVSTLTYCDPTFYIETLLDATGSSQLVANFEICEDSLPPFNSCYADFYAFPLDSLTLQFSGYYYNWQDSTAQAATYLWDFGDGTTSTEANPVHTYASEGLYFVTLTITGTDGCVSTVQYPVDTSFHGFPQCMGYILYNQTGITSFDFSAEVYDANGNIVPADSYHWDFGDGNTSDEQNPSHTYTDEGVYTVLLDAVTADGCEVHACDVVFAFDCPVDTFWYGCQAMFATGIVWDSTGFPGGFDPNGNPTGNGDPLTVSFIDLSLGGVLTWNWNFGDGSTSTEQNPTHTYAQGGNYIVTLAITTVDGCESEISFEICVGDDCWVPEFDCQAMFIPIPDSLGGNGIQFLDVSFSNTPIQQWNWDFGDGTTSNEQNPYHVYNQPGTYTVSLGILADSCNSVISFEFNTEDPWNFNREGDVAQLGVSGTSTATKEPKAVFQGAKVFPNPVLDEVNVAFTSQKACDYELRVTDISGKTINRSEQTATVGVNAARINAASLTPGLYFAEIRTSDSVQTVKFVKQ